jgi:hypothetical protein
MFSQCAPANLETSCLLEIGDISWKLRLRCGCQFPWCDLALQVKSVAGFGKFVGIIRVIKTFCVSINPEFVVFDISAEKEARAGHTK